MGIRSPVVSSASLASFSLAFTCVGVRSLEHGKIRVAETETRAISKSLGYTLFTQILLFLHDPFMLGTEKLLVTSVS